jgi:rhomboid family GlyGly-CTERM serine protease
MIEASACIVSRRHGPARAACMIARRTAVRPTRLRAHDTPVLITMHRLSSAERFALAGAALLLMLQALPALQPALEYRADSAWSQPWRLLTAHLVHVNWTHAAINAAAWWVVARLFAPELRVGVQVGALLLSAIAIGAGLALLHPGIAWYRGFSGVLHALFFAGSLRWLIDTLRAPDQRNLRALWLPVVLLAGGAIKVIVEQPAGSSTPYADWLGAGTVPQAHLLGAITGAAIGAAVAAARAPRV